MIGGHHHHQKNQENKPNFKIQFYTGNDPLRNDMVTFCCSQVISPSPSTPLRLQQVFIKPKEDISSALVAWEGGLLSLVNTCGEIGLCTPCTEATPSAEGVASVSGGWRRPPMGGWRASVGGVWAHTPFTEA